MKKSLLRARIFFFMRPQEKERATDIISHSNTIDGLLAFRTLAGPLSPLTLSTKRLLRGHEELHGTNGASRAFLPFFLSLSFSPLFSLSFLPETLARLLSHLV